jgi:hypothetical protein
MRWLPKRWLVWMPSFFGVLVLTAAILFVGRADRVTRPNWGSIKKGMTEKEVEAIMGGPCGNYSKWPRIVIAETADGKAFTPAGIAIFGPGHVPLGQSLKIWLGEEGRIVTVFGEDGRVVSTMYSETPKQCKGRVREFRSWLRRWIDNLVPRA